MSTYICEPVSRKQLRSFASEIRQSLNCQKPCFPIMGMLEVLSRINGVEYDIYDEKEWLSVFGKNVHAFYVPANQTIYIRESVYEGARRGLGRDRFTIAHEIAHTLLWERIQFNRSSIRTDQIKPYQDPEWQADCLAAELLIPYALCKHMSVSEIAEKCKVSLKAAQCQKNKFV